MLHCAFLSWLLPCRMGCALLSKPDTVCDILKTLKRNFNVPITCKIRLLEKRSMRLCAACCNAMSMCRQDTIDLLRAIEGCGVSAIGVHARRIPDRPRHRALVRFDLQSTSRLLTCACSDGGDSVLVRGHQRASDLQW